MQRDPVFVYRPMTSRRGGWVQVNPEFASAFASLGIETPAGFLDLPGEIVSGHPDRHVVRVELPGFPSAFYLKRQHRIARRERWRNWRSGFGFVSRSAREAELLQQMASASLPGPKWAAVGEDDRGRAFLLVQEIGGAVDLRRALADPALTEKDRRQLSERLGRLVALFHATGFTTPELTAKHILFARETNELTVVDWQTACRVPNIPLGDRLRALAALHASTADHLATPRERLRVMRSALRPARSSGILRGKFSDLARRIVRDAARLANRRSIRDQRNAQSNQQRLVWLADEAVCAVPEVAAIWPSPAICEPFYGSTPGTLSLQLSDGRPAHLVRGRSLVPFRRVREWLRGRVWRSPGVTMGRVLFHLERYGVPAPRLLAFGQRFHGACSLEWFALHTPPAPAIERESHDVAEQLGRCLKQLHEAGCRPIGDPLQVFGASGRKVHVRDVGAIRIVKTLTSRQRAADLKRILACLDSPCHDAVEAGYSGTTADESRLVNRLSPMSVSG